jgi:UDP-N-acetylglucosamine 2-epimerase (non-hydrolysing)
MTLASRQKRVLVAVGTRPEAIKMGPVIRCLAACDAIEVRVCATAQHRSMLDDALRIFEIVPEYDLGIMKPGQTLSDIASSVLAQIDPILQEFQPDWMLVQGDTTTTMAASVAAFHRRIGVGHVEAGLRTGDLDNPWPEEANRRITSVVTARHYCPTERARRALLREGVGDDRIIVTGNTVIDALIMIRDRIEVDSAFQLKASRQFEWIDPARRLVLVTGHRRESFGQGFQQMCAALAELARRPDVQIVYPVHLNPNVRGPVFDILGNIGAIHLIEPLDYLDFVYLMQRCYLILTDSGGIQEEAPSFGKPVLVMRETTERPEGVEAGVSRLVGTDPGRIVPEASRLLDSEREYDVMSKIKNPYGDGKASGLIVGDLVSA